MSDRDEWAERYRAEVDKARDCQTMSEALALIVGWLRDNPDPLGLVTPGRLAAGAAFIAITGKKP